MPAGMLIAGGLAAAGSIGSAIIGGNAAKKAASVQAKAADKASDTTMRMYMLQRRGLAPYANVGRGAMNTLASLYGLKGGQPYSQDAIDAFKRAPDYQVTYQNGIKAINSADAASRSLLSGAHMKNLMGFASNLADTRFNNYISRLYSLAGMGQNAAAGQGAGAMQTGSNIANLQMAAGDANASGLVASANQWSGALGNLGSNLGYLALRGMQPTSSYDKSPSLY